MKKDKLKKDQSGGITHKKDMNAGSGAFNQGSAQDPDFDSGTKVSDEEKRTGHLRSNQGKQKENPKAGKIAKNKAAAE